MLFQCDKDDKSAAKARLAKAMPVLLNKIGVSVYDNPTYLTNAKFKNAWKEANGSTYYCPLRGITIYAWMVQRSYPQRRTSRPGLNKLFAYYGITQQEIDEYHRPASSTSTDVAQDNNQLTTELTALLAAVKAAGLTITIK